MRKLTILGITLFVMSGLLFIGVRSIALADDPASLTPLEELGKAMFYDTDLSVNGTQSCAACHAAEVGYTGPDVTVNLGGAVYQGALPNHFGNRKPPAAAYAGESPLLHFDTTLGGWFGGMFWDGRASGATLADPLAEQAQGPFLNPLEQALANAQVLCVRVKQSEYADLLNRYGEQTPSIAPRILPAFMRKLGVLWLLMSAVLKLIPSPRSSTCSGIMHSLLEKMLP